MSVSKKKTKNKKKKKAELWNSESNFETTKLFKIY